MQEILLTIAERCHAAATKRGKDTTGVGCIQSLRMELREYWKAADKATETPEFDEIIEQAGKLSDNDFAAYYEANLHNTATDELADILIGGYVAVGSQSGSRREFPARQIYRCYAADRSRAVCLRADGRPARHREAAHSG